MYLGVWLSTGNTFAEHIKIMSGKIKKTINASWENVKRAKISSLRTRLKLMQAIAKSAMLYGVEIWECKVRELIARLRARYVKMAMGIRQNTSDYIWRMEWGCRGIGIKL